MTTAAPQLRRIALRVAGVQHDLALPFGDALAHALAVAGVRLGPADRVIDPAGTVVDVSTPAAELREGGLYSVTGPTRRGGAREPRDPARASDAPGLLWVLVTLGGTAALVALVTPQPGARPAATAVLGVSALLAALVWALRGTERTAIISMAAPLVLGAAAGALAVPGPLGADAQARAALAWAGVALLASVIALAGARPRLRAAAGPVVAISAVLAGLTLLSSVIGWSLAQLTIVTGAAAVVGIRAAPSLLVGLDEGYFIDYGRFMVLRWTVRGRVPKFRTSIDLSEVRERIGLAESRLEATVLMFSALAAAGVALLALPLSGEALIERISASVALVCIPLALLLTSRRMSARELRFPPRIAVAAGLLGLALGLGVIDLPLVASIVGVVALVGGIVAAALVVPVAGGHRSLGWSRTGDMVDSIAVALALPAALGAAGTLDLLRGALVG